MSALWCAPEGYAIYCCIGSSDFSSVLIASVSDRYAAKYQGDPQPLSTARDTIATQIFSLIQRMVGTDQQV